MLLLTAFFDLSIMNKSIIFECNQIFNPTLVNKECDHLLFLKLTWYYNADVDLRFENKNNQIFKETLLMSITVMIAQF